MRRKPSPCPQQCDRPVQTIRDGMHDVFFRSVTEIARRISLEPSFVDAELRKMSAAGEVEKKYASNEQTPVLATFRRSTAWRLDETDQARRLGAQSRKGPRARGLPRHLFSGPVTPCLNDTVCGFPVIVDAKVSDFLAHGVEGGAK